MLVQPAGGDGGDTAPLTLDQASRLPLVIPSRPNAIRMHVEAQMAAAGCQPTVALEIDSVRAILDLVESGAGMAILTRQTVGSAPRPDAFGVRRILMPAGTPLRIPLYTAVSALRPATATQQAVLALVRAIARERLDNP